MNQEQNRAHALRIAQPVMTTHEKTLQRNLNRRYVHVSRDLMYGSDGKLDFAHREVKDKNGVVHRLYPAKGETYNVGSNKAKRENRRAHVLARVEARAAR